MLRRICILALVLALGPPLAAQESDRQLLERIQAEIAAHLGEGPAPPPQPPPASGVTLERYEETNANGDSHQAHGRTEPAGALLWPTLIVTDAEGNPVGGLSGTWEVVEGGGRISVETDPTMTNGAAMARWWLGSTGRQVVRATYGGQPIDFVAQVSGGGGGVHPPEDPPPSTDVPPAPGPDASSWTGNTIPVRIIETRGVPGQPVAVTITADGESRTFHRPSVGAGRTIHVPRTATLTVTAHVTPTASAGLGGYGFAGLKIKAMNAAWGFGPDQITGANSASWEPYTNNAMPGQPDRVAGWVWGGSLTTVCGSMPPGHTGPWWRYQIPGWVPTRAGVDFLVVWILDHQYPRHSC